MDSIRKFKNYLLAEGIIFIILGLLAIALPVFFTLAFELTIGWLLLIAGLALGYRVFKSRGTGFVAALLSSLLYIVFGLLLLLYPIKGVLALTFFLALFYFLEGITEMVYGALAKPIKNWGWLVVNGILALIIALIIWSGWPETSYWVIGLLVGINLLFYGISRVVIATTQKVPTSQK